MTPLQRIMQKWKPRRYINLIENGDFLNDVNNWSGSQSILSVTDSKLTCKISSGYYFGGARNNNLNGSVLGHKYYSFIKAHVNNNDCSELKLSLNTYGSSNINSISNPIKDVVYFISGIKTCETVPTYAAMYHSYATSEIAEGKEAILHESATIDLTELGLEDRSQEWCDKYIAPNVDYWNFVNELENGDLLNGRDKWVVSDATYTLSSESIVAMPTDIYGRVTNYFQFGNNDEYADHNFYHCAMLKTNSTKVRLHLNDGTRQSELPPTTLASFTLVSGILKIQSGYTTIKLKVQDNDPDNRNEFEVKDFKLIDLTKLGLDNVTAEWCDQNIAPYVNMERYDNLIENGDFSDGLDGWLDYNTSATATSNILSIFPNNVNITHYHEKNISNLAIGNKYYICGNVEELVNCSIELQFWNRIENGGFERSLKMLTSSSGIVSTIFTPSGKYHNPYARYRWTLFKDGSAVFLGTDEVAKISKCIVINLTAKYGMGNEPSKEWCDENIAPYINY